MGVQYTVGRTQHSDRVKILRIDVLKRIRKVSHNCIIPPPKQLSAKRGFFGPVISPLGDRENIVSAGLPQPWGTLPKTPFFIAPPKTHRESV